MSVEEAEHLEDEHSAGLFDRQVVSLPSDDGMQWRAALMQLVNWGGFGGLTTVPLRGDEEEGVGDAVQVVGKPGEDLTVLRVTRALQALL